MLAVRLPPTVPSDLGVQVAYQKEFSNACVSCARGMIFDGQFDRSVRSAAFEQQQQHHNAQDAYAGASPDESLASEDSLAAATERSSTPPNTGGHSTHHVVEGRQHSSSHACVFVAVTNTGDVAFEEIPGRDLARTAMCSHWRGPVTFSRQHALGKGDIQEALPLQQVSQQLYRSLHSG